MKNLNFKEWLMNEMTPEDSNLKPISDFIRKAIVGTETTPSSPENIGQNIANALKKDPKFNTAVQNFIAKSGANFVKKARENAKKSGPTPTTAPVTTPTTGASV